MKRLAVVTAMAVAAAACAGPQTPVPVVGNPPDLERLAGEWLGEFSSVETGRRGSIVFHLIAGTDSAHGDVVLDPLVWGWRARQDEINLPGVAPQPGESQLPRSLNIRFVRVAGDRVSGRLVPHLDPTCNCRVYTTFEGRLVADTLGGTYTSRHEGGWTAQRGEWRVVRSAPHGP